MKERKQSSSWYIAATHYLTAGFAIPLVVNIIAAFTVIPLFGSTGSPIVVFAGTLAIGLVAIWFGVMYSVNYLKKTYIILDPKRIVKFSTAYLVVVLGGVLIFSQIVQGLTIGGIILAAINFVVVVTVFNFASTKYLDGITPNSSSSS